LRCLDLVFRMSKSPEGHIEIIAAEPIAEINSLSNINSNKPLKIT